MFDENSEQFQWKFGAISEQFWWVISEWFQSDFSAFSGHVDSNFGAISEQLNFFRAALINGVIRRWWNVETVNCQLSTVNGAVGSDLKLTCKVELQLAFREVPSCKLQTFATCFVLLPHSTASWLASWGLSSGVAGCCRDSSGILCRLVGFWGILKDSLEFWRILRDSLGILQVGGRFFTSLNKFQGFFMDSLVLSKDFYGFLEIFLENFLDYFLVISEILEDSLEILLRFFIILKEL